MFKRLLLAALAAALYVIPAQAKPLIAATDATWPPFETLDANKKVVGYGPEYLLAVGKEAGLEIEVRNTAWDGIFAALGAKQCDIIVSSVTITEERKATMDFTKPYYTNHQALVVRKDSPITSVAELSGKTVGGQIGTTGMLYVEKLNGTQKLGAIIKEYDEVGLAMEDLKNGRIDSVMCDDGVAKYYAERKEGYARTMKVALVTGDVEYYGFAVRKGDTELLAKLNKGIEAVQQKGIEAALLKKWMGE